MNINVQRIYCYTWAVHKVTELFLFLIYCFTYNLIKFVSFKVLPSVLDVTFPTFFFSSGTRPGTCFVGWRKGPVSNFLLSPLPSEIGDLSVRISNSGTRKSPQGPNLESRAALERSNSSWLTVTRFSFCAPVTRRGKKFCGNTTHLQFVGQNQVVGTFYGFLLLRQLHGQLGDDFDESQQAFSRRDRRPLTWKAVQIWGRLRWTFCPIWNAGTIRDIAYGLNSPLHKPVVTSEKPP